MHRLTLALALLPFARAFRTPVAWHKAAVHHASQIAPQSEYLDSLASPVHDTETDDNKDDAKQQSSIDWRAVWYPVAIDADMDRKLPLQLTLLNEELALW
jgi:hypothetical protein